jgi:hypothetical protein
MGSTGLQHNEVAVSLEATIVLMNKVICLLAMVCCAILTHNLHLFESIFYLV